MTELHETDDQRRDRGYRNLDDDLAKSDLYDKDNPEEEEDVFTPKNVPAATLITLLRIYDLLSVMVMEEHPEYVSVLEHHAKGGIAGPPPFFIPEGMDISGPTPQPPMGMENESNPTTTVDDPHEADHHHPEDEPSAS